jgi:hypothetical protein
MGFMPVVPAWWWKQIRLRCAAPSGDYFCSFGILGTWRLEFPGEKSRWVGQVGQAALN